jgi:hypothetical protein
MNKLCLVAVFYLLPFLLLAQNKNAVYFITEGLINNPTLTENTNLQQFFQIQNDIITAQNKKPQVNFTADYIFTPFFFSNGHIISVTPNPSSKAYGYDAAVYMPDS